jgi:ribonuclease HI
MPFNLNIKTTNTPAAHITYHGKSMSISAPFNPEFVAELKAKTGSRRWNPDDKAWLVSVKEKKEVLEIIGRHYSAIVEDEKPSEIRRVTPPQNSNVPVAVSPGDTVEIWTDGACINNPGPGGYATVLIHKGTKYEKVGGFRLTTNNRMEIYGAIAALESLQAKCRVKISSDSQYVVNAISRGWAEKWRSKQWKNKQEPVPNRDLWERLLRLCAGHEVEFTWVKGHNDQPENERCNELAENYARSSDLPPDEEFENRR